MRSMKETLICKTKFQTKYYPQKREHEIKYSRRVRKM
jgi:hypothetical protein